MTGVGDRILMHVCVFVYMNHMENVARGIVFPSSCFGFPRFFFLVIAFNNVRCENDRWNTNGRKMWRLLVVVECVFISI